jgi:signal transduction histidine kinase
MKHPWQVWLVLAACGALLAAAMSWLTLHALRADRERTAARAAADLEQQVSLALWRMDTKLAPLIAEESARPHFYYAPFITVETPRSKAGPAEEQVASPLLVGQNTSVVLNFNASASGEWSSPQAPPPELTDMACENGMTVPQIESNRARLSELAANVTFADLLAQLPDQPLPRTTLEPSAESAVQVALAPNSSAANSRFYDNAFGVDAANAANPQGGETAQLDSLQQQYGMQTKQQGEVEQLARSAPAMEDLGARGRRYQLQVGQEYMKQRRENFIRLTGEGAIDAVVENVSRPVWVGDRLLLARRVERGGTTMVQGSWLDWPQLKRDLLAETSDLLPAADLAAVRPGEAVDPTRMLAGLPVRLIAGASPGASSAHASPLRWALGVGWASVVLALIAVAGLLWGVMALSERRAAFVSSVTHELRTPLTTFRMYAEMLVRDMVPSPERRREYLQTLRTEAERLTHLVDNVLAYARLERGRAPRRSERTTPAALLERFEPRLEERAGQANMTLECVVDESVARATMITDVGVIEQILFNLVDNAAKYAARAADRRIHLNVRSARNSVVFEVRDHGPGFASLRAAQRSTPFSKSAEDAAESAPGVGLGLALCRRLARELGGRLEIESSNGSRPGAVASLHLPLGA